MWTVWFAMIPRAAIPKRKILVGIQTRILIWQRLLKKWALLDGVTVVPVTGMVVVGIISSMGI